MPKRRPPARARRVRPREPLTTVAESREALDFWLGRLERLPHRRRRARREARVMVARWEQRHRDAVLAARGARRLGRLALALGLEALLRPPRAPGGAVERRRRRRALARADRVRRRDRLLRRGRGRGRGRVRRR